MRQPTGPESSHIALDRDWPSVAVIIPTLNEELHIGRCLAGLIKLDYPRERVRIRVVDNFSSDRTVEVARGFGVETMQVPKSTIAKSRNAGAKGAREDIVAFLDADCVPASSWLRHAVRHFVATDVAAVGSYPGVIAEESNLLQKTWAAINRRSGDGVTVVGWLPSANLLVRTESLARVGGFNEALTTCEDVDLTYRLSAQGRILYDPEILVYHLREPQRFKDLFWKEIWHARSNFSGITSHGLQWRELPSLFAPLAFGVGAVAGTIGLLAGSGVSTCCGFGVSTVTVVLYSVRAMRRTARFDMAMAIYVVYFSARFYAAIRETARSLQRRLSPNLRAG
ncbi:MAG: glycosyltransferase [Candidatus Competibacteraceae bacterium]|nr:glycosyltransferase [Candidatus Competibacteraceae bacterium]